jgi:hypothetical protein
MFQVMDFDDGRGEYSDVIRARAPRGLREKVKEVADQKGVSSAELIRQAVCSYIEGDQVRVGAFTPARSLAYVLGA